MKIFVISLLHSDVRRAHVDEQLRAQNVAYRFFDAIDGKSGYQSFFDGYDATEFLLRTGRIVTPGEIGCFASHRHLWNLSVQVNEPILIMEDDIELDFCFPRALDTARRLIDRYGFIRLQTESRGKSIKVEDVEDFCCHYYTKVPHGAGAYCISPEVAQTFLTASHVLTAPVDVFIKNVWEHRCPVFGLLPYTVRLSPLACQSTIGTRQKAPKDVQLRSARLLEKARAVTRRALFNRSAERWLRI